jgi:cytochrome bd ubiquinol oxidase subunit II
MNADYLLPIIFIGLMGLAFLVYAVLDGYDLGVGILLPQHDRNLQDQMIASIGPFWDANETWLVLAIGVLLIAFPAAHSQILMHLYLPVTLMLIGLILRGVAFDFRAKAPLGDQSHWDKAFQIGSVLAALAQGFMLGHYIMGFAQTPASYLFASLCALSLCAAYALIGASWLVLKTQGACQARAARLGQWAARFTGLSIVAVSLVNPWVNPSILEKWLAWPMVALLWPIPLLAMGCLLLAERRLARVPQMGDTQCWVPFAATAGVFVLCFIGLAYSFFPQVVPGGITIWQAASASASLAFILWGVALVLPCILGYTLYSYWVFWGKSQALSYYPSDTPNG